MDNEKDHGGEQKQTVISECVEEMRQLFYDHDLSFGEIRKVLGRIESEISLDNHLSRTSMYLNTVKYKDLMSSPYAQGSTCTSHEDR